jgi:long-chain acyl-CoA synthetase
MSWTLDEYIRRNGLRFPQKAGLVMGERVFTWAEVDDRVNRVANALLALGLERNERVAIVLHNRIEYPELYYGIGRAGLINVPCSYRLSVPELAEILSAAEPSLLVVAANEVEKAVELRPLLPTLKHVWVLDGAEQGTGDTYEDVLAASSPEPVYSPNGENDTFAIFFTSGTTGLPKGAMVSNLNLEANGFNQFVADGSLREDVNLIASPLYHMGAVFVSVTYVMLGCTQVIIPRFDPEPWLEAVECNKVSVALLIPTMINTLINFPGLKNYDVSSLRRVFYGGGPMPPAVLKRAIETLRCGFTQGYGLTETLEVSFLVASDHVSDGTESQVRHMASAGREAVGADVRIVDDAGQEMPMGEVGEIIIRSRSNISGYWGNPEETAQAVRGDWFYTGDLGYLDDERYLYVVDRKKDMVVSGGVNIFTKEIESVLYTHPAVLEAAVIATPDDHWGEIVTACVVLRAGLQAGSDEIIEFCSASLAGYKKPRKVYFLDELPKNPSGKILKRELRVSLAERPT